LFTVPGNSTANVVGGSHYVRVEVPTATAVHDPEKELGVVKALTEIIAGPMTR
jgi:hypothetical protein